MFKRRKSKCPVLWNEKRGKKEQDHADAYSKWMSSDKTVDNPFLGNVVKFVEPEQVPCAGESTAQAL